MSKEISIPKAPERRRLFFEIAGVQSMLQHRGAMADPSDQWAIKLAELTDNKKKKTPETRQQIRDTEWQGSMYRDDRISAAPPSTI
jgi:hypothetical protein